MSVFKCNQRKLSELLGSELAIITSVQVGQHGVICFNMPEVLLAPAWAASEGRENTWVSILLILLQFTMLIFK